MQQLRRLLLCGEWIRSHSRQIYRWHAVHLLGYSSPQAMALDYPAVAARARRLNRLGVQLLQTVGGRSSRLCPGGFSELPQHGSLQALVGELEWALEAAADTAMLVCRLPVFRWDRDYRWLAAFGDAYTDSNGSRIAVAGGEPLTPAAVMGLSIRPPHPPLYTGPLARFALRREALPAQARRLADDCRLVEGLSNPYKSVIVRAVEMAAAAEEGLALIRGYRAPASANAPLRIAAGEGWGSAESAAGLVLQHCRLDGAGRVLQAARLTPAELSRTTLERDLRDHLAMRPQPEPAALLPECQRLLGIFDAALADRLQLVAPAELA